MSPQSNFWSKLLPGLSHSDDNASAAAQIRLLQGLISALTDSPIDSAPGNCLKQVVDILGANAGWMYGLAENEPDALILQEQAGPQATQETARQSGHALAVKTLITKEAVQPTPGMVAIPLISQEKTIGVAVLWFAGEIPYLPDDVGACLGFALAYAHLGEQAWREAAERRQLEARLEKACADECQQDQELALLNSLIAAIVSGANQETILKKLCHELVETFRVTQAAAALLDDRGEILHVVAEFVPPDRMPCVGMDIPVSNNPSSLYVIRMKTPLAVSDVQHDIRMTPIYELMKQRGVASILILPLMVKDRVIGTIGVDSASPREYSEAEIALALKAATLAAWAVAHL
jgi:hypothetical protein